jgi:hypothetical protein
MFTIQTNDGNTLTGIRLPELVQLSDKKKVRCFNVEDGPHITRVVSVDSLRIIVSETIKSNLKTHVMSGYPERVMDSINIPEEELETAYCYHYVGIYHPTTMESASKWTYSEHYPVLSIELKSSLSDDSFFIQSRTALSPEEIKDWKRKAYQEWSEEEPISY